MIGVMEPKGEVLGLDLDDAVFIPAARAMELLNRSGLIEIQVSYRPSADVEMVLGVITERTSVIGLLRALGAQERQVLVLFLGEAILLSALGGLAGLAMGVGIAQGLHLIFPALPVHTPWLFAIVAELTATSIGLVAGVTPAIRAARLDPVETLHAE